MTAAAMLATMGKRVLVLEQHYTPGGFTHTFKRPGYEWDVGVHAVGEVSLHTTIGRLLKRLTKGKLEWASLGDTYDEFTFPDGFRITFPDSPAAFRATLLEAFPDEAIAIDAYLAEVRAVAKSMRGYYMSRALPGWASKLMDFTLAADAQKQMERHTDQVIAGITDNPKLRTILTAQWGYYGSPPSRSSFAIQALVAKHFMHGGFYPVGGSQRIAEGLLATVADAGGWTRVRADVERIIIDGDRATGVKLTDGEEIFAPLIVSAAGVQSTVSRLLPESDRQADWGKEVTALPPAAAHVCLYIGFKGDIRAAGAGAANQWFYDTWDSEAIAWDVEPGKPMPKAPCLYTSFPSLKDPEHEPGDEQRHTGEVVTFVPWEIFEPWLDSSWKKRDESYETFKKAMHDSLLEQFLERMPELAPLIDFTELGTPLTTDHFVRPQRGSIYGIEPTPDRFRCDALRPRSPYKGLVFGGSEVASLGVIGAMMGGVLAAAAAEPRKALKILRE